MKTISIPKTPHFLLSLLVLSLAVLLGGGQGTFGDTLLQLTSIALLVILLQQNPDLRTWPKASAWAILPMVPLLLFLLPWPSAWQLAGEARGQLFALLQPVIGQLGMQGSLSPMASERALFWLLPAIALYCAVLQMQASEKKYLVAALIFWVFVGAIVGLAQKADGVTSALYFFSNTNRGSSVGFFANNNHYAMSLAITLPLVWATLIGLFNRRMQLPVHPLWFVMYSGVAILFIIGFMLSGSRAGLALGMLGCLLMLPVVIMADQHKGAKHWVLAVFAIGLFFSIQLGLYFISMQFAPDPMSDLRLEIFPVVREAAAQFAPIGSGPGSFWYAFPHYGGMLAGDLIINHAHNDYLELWMEMRWLFIATAMPLLLAFLWQSVRVWFRARAYKIDSLLLARTASICLFILILHSALDYPLRTSALLAITGILAALLASPEREPVQENTE